MTFFDNSILGFDFNMDGEVDMMDDVCFMGMVESMEAEENDDDEDFMMESFDE